MALEGLLVWLAVAAAAASAPTTVPEFAAPVGGPSGASVQGSGPAPSLTASVLTLAPGLGLTPLLAPAVVPALQPGAVRAEAQKPAALQPIALGFPVSAASKGAAAAPDAAEREKLPGAGTFDGLSAKPKIDLDAIEFAQGSAVVDRLLRDYDPASHAFVGVGRSPAILVALMQNRAPGLANTLPLSDFYHHPAGREKYYAPLSSAIEDRLFDHFDRFLPAEARSGAKKLVLLDFLKGGRSMIALDEYLKLYAARRSPGLSWEFFGLGLAEQHAGFAESGRSYRVLKPHELEGPPILHTRMSFSWNKDWAEYREFPAPFEDEAALERRAEYEAWRRRLAQRMLSP